MNTMKINRFNITVAKAENRISHLLVIDRLGQLSDQVPQLVLEVKDFLFGQMSLAAHQWKRLRA